MQKFSLLGRLLLIALGIMVLWQLVVMITGLPKFILPSPLQVFQTLNQRIDLIAEHASITALEILLGMLCGCVAGFLSALSLQMFKPIRPWLLPLLVISQAIPVFAVAPLLMVWFGYGMSSKIIMASLIIFFPVAAACYDGLRQTPQGWLDLAQTMQANAWQQLRYIRLPASLPSLASGLRVAASVAPIGAVVGEWVGSSEGLGYLMLHANARMQIDLMFASLFVLALMALILYFGIDVMLRKMLPWVNHQ
ncbi:ABC transporter permease [Pelistega indica]|uniref:ABC transporter permease n=1 Tax=Pelistega indica TaxID=1414851 RepID=V8FTC6_9BURK|nr:ABC transporter permease [Pelistega indica]ETD66948.1 ABC transporter permease [Pelistega indica]